MIYIKNKNQFLVFSTILGIAFFFVGNKIGEAYRITDGDMLTKLGYVSDNLTSIILSIHFSFNYNDILWGLSVVFCWALFVVYNLFARNNFRMGEEHGSARWGTKEDIKNLVDKDKFNNMIFTNSERISLNTRKTMRSNNVLVIGGTGTGKTRFFIKPNILQMHSSYVITDPKGNVLDDVGNMLDDNGYDIRTFNTVDFSKSMHYNPFGFIKSESDIKVFVDLFIANTKEKGEKASDPFWENAERLVYMALIGYIMFFTPEEDQNFATLNRMINKMEVHEDEEGFLNEIDHLFLEVELGTEEYLRQFGNIEELKNYSSFEKISPQPEHFCVTQYKKFKLAAGKTTKSILISCGVRLAPFDIKEIRELTMYDEMDLQSLGDKKTALFIIIDDKISSFNFLASIMYAQLFKELCDKADNFYRDKGNRLPVHVRCLIDEFANIGQIPDFEKIISIIRSREISVDVIVQNPAQIKAIYGDNAKTIEGNCDSLLFLGSGEQEVNKYISDMLGKTTIDHKGTSTSKGQNGSYSISDQILGRELLTADEVGILPNDECILRIRGVRPFKSKKYNLEKHERYNLIADSGHTGLFNLNDYLARRRAKMAQLAKEERLEKQGRMFDDDIPGENTDMETVERNIDSPEI